MINAIRRLFNSNKLVATRTIHFTTRPEQISDCKQRVFDSNRHVMTPSFNSHVSTHQLHRYMPQQWLMLHCLFIHPKRQYFLQLWHRPRAFLLSSIRRLTSKCNFLGHTWCKKHQVLRPNFLSAFFYRSINNTTMYIENKFVHLQLKTLIKIK